MSSERSIFASISPLDYRYWDEKFEKYFSEEAFIRYKLQVELALVMTLMELNICDASVVAEVHSAIKLVTAEEIYAEEEVTRHDIRALVNCIQRRVTENARPFVHMTATSFDISDTANAARFREGVMNMLIPELEQLDYVLAQIADREADTVQIGRTHGQHAVPITFGFAVASYLSRLNASIGKLYELTRDLRGKFSGAVGAYNASSLFFDNPSDFERRVLHKMDLNPGEHSTQIVQPEPMARLMSEVAIAAGILANLSRDMRNLQRSEIGEVGEEFGGKQVGSSTMPQKRNPINFENAESMWKIILGRMVTVYMDQISDHQRDLTNSASARTYGEMICYLAAGASRLAKTMSKLSVDKTNMRRNLESQGDLILAEPLYIILASLGHPDAHEAVRKLTLRAQAERRKLGDLAREDESLKPFFERMTERQKAILADPNLYTGIAPEIARRVAKIPLAHKRKS